MDKQTLNTVTSKVQEFNCYKYNDDLLLIEMLIDDYSNNIDLGKFVVPEKGLDKSNWQCAYLEQYLNTDGTKRICELYDEPEKSIKPCRIAFFLYRFDEQEKKLLTPYGEFSLKKCDHVPKRLADCIEFEDAD